MKLLLTSIGLVLAIPIAQAEFVEYTVAGSSMRPTLVAGDQIGVNKEAYRKREPRVGELVSIRFNHRARPMVKRVVAIAGDRLRFDQGGLWRGQTKIAGAARLTKASSGVALKAQLSNYGNVLPPRTLVLLGDNPDNSKDSLRYGLVSYEQVMGKVESINGVGLAPNFSKN